MNLYMGVQLSDRELIDRARTEIMTPNEIRAMAGYKPIIPPLSDHDILERIEELMNNEFVVRMTYDIVPNEIKYTFWKKGENIIYADDRIVYCENSPKYTVTVDLWDPNARDPLHIANEVLKLENEEMKVQKSLSDPPKPAEYVPIKCKVCGAPMTHGQLKCIYCGQEYLKVERN